MEAAALAYAKRGYPVFPCRPRGKEPLTPQGFKDATTDPAQVRRWWGRWPDANVAIPTGERSGLLVLDGGNDSLSEWIEEDEDLPYTTVVLTGGGGYHHYYNYPEGETIGSSVGRVGAGLDIRAEGGYVVAPPSVTDEPYRTLHKRPLAQPPTVDHGSPQEAPRALQRERRN